MRILKLKVAAMWIAYNHLDGWYMLLSHNADPVDSFDYGDRFDIARANARLWRN